jgi:Na+-transporting methylmalonyl-CoA/oxaloacetate decarboxylase gamma subunit
METEIFGAGLNLMLVGIATVTVFLSILVGATKLMSLIVMEFYSRAGNAITEADEIAAAAAAVSRYRQEHRAPGSNDR